MTVCCDRWEFSDAAEAIGRERFKTLQQLYARIAEDTAVRKRGERNRIIERDNSLAPRDHSSTLPRITDPAGFLAPTS